MGGDAIQEALEEHLDVHAGETTDDGGITLEHIECNAACDYAPVVMVNWEFFDNQTPSSAPDLRRRTARGPSRCPPTRGAPCAHSARPPAFSPDSPTNAPAPRRWTGRTATLVGLASRSELDMTGCRVHRTHAAKMRVTRRRSPPNGTRRGGRRRVHPRPARPGTGNHRARSARHHGNRPQRNGFGD